MASDWVDIACAAGIPVAGDAGWTRTDRPGCGLDSWLDGVAVRCTGAKIAGDETTALDPVRASWCAGR